MHLFSHYASAPACPGQPWRWRCRPRPSPTRPANRHRPALQDARSLHASPMRGGRRSGNRPLRGPWLRLSIADDSSSPSSPTTRQAGKHFPWRRARCVRDDAPRKPVRRQHLLSGEGGLPLPVILPLPKDRYARIALVMHETFHREQEALVSASPTRSTISSTCAPAAHARRARGASSPALSPARSNHFPDQKAARHHAESALLFRASAARSTPAATASKRRSRSRRDFRIHRPAPRHAAHWRRSRAWRNTFAITKPTHRRSSARLPTERAPRLASCSISSIQPGDGSSDKSRHIGQLPGPSNPLQRPRATSPAPRALGRRNTDGTKSTERKPLATSPRAPR